MGEREAEREVEEWKRAGIGGREWREEESGEGGRGMEEGGNRREGTEGREQKGGNRREGRDMVDSFLTCAL